MRELRAVREIAQAFLTAGGPAEVYRIALERVAPLVGAEFGCVFVRDAEDDLLRVVAAYNWPQAFASYLSDMRVRPGNGPTGRAFVENAVIEVWDIFADEALQDWWDSAGELGFASTVALPLAFRDEPIGALTFYFREPEQLCDADRSLLRLVADQLAATAEKAHLIHDLQEANSRLREQNVELEARYREAEEARRLKSELLANVSHELRTPLTAILGYAYLLREGLSGELAPEQNAAVDRIESAATALMRLINDLLDLTHLRLGRTTIEPEVCDALALVRAAISALPPLSPTVTLHTSTPEEPVRIVTDPVQVLRILQNLISNAFKFTLEGAITIRIRQIDPAVPAEDAAEEDTDDEEHRSSSGVAAIEWEIQDTGIGIDPGEHETIFDEFRQVDGSATRRFGGTGLGLALARGLARRLGGDITVRSALGEGATFTLTLPVTLPRPDPSSGTPENEPSSRLRILP
jgi:signal transduction histidine kinase